MQQRFRRLSWLPAIVSIIAVGVSVGSAAERPNIVLIMSDDMGFSDLGCYGGEIETPNLDRLAAAGLRFTQFYNTGRCCPTRASLLTGLYPHQAGVGWMMTDRGYDGYRGDLNRRCVTIAEALRPAGYATYMVGKWHVTKHTDPEGPKHNWPLQRGFDRFYGTITGAGSFYDPGTLTRDNTMISPLADPEYTPQQYYYTDALSDHAVRYINEHYQQPSPSKKPFFMYVAYTCAHWPMHALEEDIAKYRGKYDAGYGPIRQARFERVKERGLVSPTWDLTPQAGDWASFEHQEWEARCMEVYAAMIDNMDQGIGRIVEALAQHDQLDDTLIFFLQDNGGCQEGVGRSGNWKRPVEPSLAKIPDDAIRLDVIPKQNRAGVPTLQGPGIMPGPEDTYIAYGINWANVSNTPFREYKHFVHEGGIATPLIAHWPAGIKRHGDLDHQPGHLIDLMATCVDVAGAEYPEQFAGEKIRPVEGTSLVPAFAGNPLGRREPIFWEHEGNRAVREGRWKLVAKENRPWELYDMEADRTEMHDLADDRPEVAKDLAAKWDAWAERADVLPLGAWRGKSKKTSFNKKQKRFELKAGDDLPREEAPFVEGRSLLITATVAEMAAEGVLVAQGGSAEGFSLYVKDGKPTFATRHGGHLHVVASAKAVDAEQTQLTAVFDKDGTVTITVDGRELACGKTPGPLTRMPLDGLQVGSDQAGAVGEYSPPFPFAGKIDGVILEIGK
jgi:arylsulfatase